MVLMVVTSVISLPILVETVVAAVEQGAAVRSPRSRAWRGGRGGGGEKVSWRKRDTESGGRSAGDCQDVLVPH